VKMTLLRELLWTRSLGLCDCCGRPLPERWELHHRMPGGMGGTRRDRDVPSNAVALRPSCHNLAPGSVHMTPRAARMAGLIVSPNRATWEDVPILLHGRRLVLLTDEGGYDPCDAAMDRPAPPH
jgi:5-methylcytosine-specific restriction enzyme A